ncbi:hypothetical protein ACWF94_10390 [Streptomyces sp. NPDC055078]
MNGLLAVVSAVGVGVAVVCLLFAVLPGRSRSSARYASFRVGPLRVWCPAEEAMMPHLVDAGGRQCLSCKTTTRTPEDRHV